MREIALHLLDLAQNSIQAGAKLVEISLAMDPEGLLTMVIQDDGCGMDAQTLQKVQSPFATSRTTRKVGLGIPLTKEHAQASGGRFEMSSMPGQGTKVTAAFVTTHLDCPPLGKLTDTMLALVLANPEVPDFTLSLQGKDGSTARLDTRQIKQAIDPLPLSTPQVADWLRDNLQEMAHNTLGGDGA